MASQCSPEADNAFGPAVADACREGFDFTLAFEQSILSLFPGVIFILAAAVRLKHLSGESKKTVFSIQRGEKLILAALLVGLQITTLVLWALDRAAQTKFTIAATAINLVVALQLVFITWIEDSRSVRPSSLLNVYLLFTSLLDLSQIRTLWLLGHKEAIAAVFSASTATKAALLLLEAQGKRTYLEPLYQTLPPESTSGIISRSMLWWINTLFLRGIRNVLTLSDLYSLDEKLTSASVRDRLQNAWERRRRPERRYEFVVAVYRGLWRSLLATFFPRICMIAFTFAQPLLIARVLEIITEPETQKSWNEGYGLIGATGLIYIGSAVARVHYHQNLYRFITMFRGASVALVYNHALHLPESEHTDSRAVTLMSTDVDRIADSLAMLDEVWARLVEVVVGVTLLALQLGWVCIVPIVTSLLAFLATERIASSIGDRQKVWVEAVQKRLSVTSAMLADMRSVRMMGLGDVVADMVQRLRVQETHSMAGFLWSIVWQNVVQNLPWALAPALTLGVYSIQATARGEQSLETTQAFVSLSIIGLLTDPIARLLSAIPGTASSLGCFDRMQEFLVLASREDPRHLAGRISSSAQGAGAEATSGDIELQPVDNPARATGGSSTTDAIVVDGVEVRPAASASFVLQQISFAIGRGSLTMIIGAVGSGKSTLLRAILGEVIPTKGVITVSTKRIAFCAQKPWLPNVTIRQAICRAKEDAPVDEDLYRTVVHACALEQDFGLLTDGDRTKIGSGSTVLSGGQRQRVALARALYARAEIVILDDVLSALDSNTQKTVVSRVLSKDGFLRKIGSTALLVTHAAEYLPFSDKVLVLSNGGVEYEGTYEQVVRHKLADIVRLESHQPGEQESLKESSEMERKALEVSERNELDDLTRATGDWAVYRYYFKGIGPWRLLLFVAAVMANVFGTIFGFVWVSWWTDNGGSSIALYSSIYLLLAIMSALGIFGYAGTMLILISPKTSRNFHHTLLKVVSRAPLSFFGSTDSGTILNRFSQDMTLIETRLPTGVLATISNLFMSIGSVSLVATGSTYMAISIPFLIIAIAGIQHVYLRTSRQLRLLDLEAKAPLHLHFLESLDGLATIRAFGWERYFEEENVRLLDLSQRPFYLHHCIQRWLNLVLELMVGAQAILVVGLSLGLRTSTNPGLLGVSLNNILAIGSDISNFVLGFTLLETSLGAIARLKGLEDAVLPEDKAEEKNDPPPSWPHSGAIEFRNVTASHSSNAVGIRNVSLTIQPGQKVGICGRTGSGKSSLVGTLLRLLEIDSGSVLVDDLDLATLPRSSIRSKLVVIPQDPLLLPATVRLNADPRGEHLDEAIIAALRRVRLWDILSERGGLEGDITGVSLSQGQKQLFALARATLMHEGKRLGVLLLDEATSSVDGETDEHMRTIIKENFADWTVVTVAHRIDSIMNSDLIVVMEEGQVAETGRPKELLKKRGKFAAIATGWHE